MSLGEFLRHLFQNPSESSKQSRDDDFDVNDLVGNSAIDNNIDDLIDNSERSGPWNSEISSTAIQPSDQNMAELTAQFESAVDYAKENPRKTLGASALAWIAYQKSKSSPQPQQPTYTPRKSAYHVFISHAWDYSEHYHNLKELLEGAEEYGFSMVDYSVPEEKKLSTSTIEELEAALHDQIKPASVVIVSAGMYVAHRRWIKKEIEIAESIGKPVIGVKPWGNTQMPAAVTETAAETVGWQTSSLIDAICQEVDEIE